MHVGRCSPPRRLPGVQRSEPSQERDILGSWQGQGQGHTAGEGGREGEWGDRERRRGKERGVGKWRGEVGGIRTGGGRGGPETKVAEKRERGSMKKKGMSRTMTKRKQKKPQGQREGDREGGLGDGEGKRVRETGTERGSSVIQAHRARASCRFTCCWGCRPKWLSISNPS